MANARRKKTAASGRSSSKKAAPRRKSSTGGPPLWLIFAGLVAAGLAVYFMSRHGETRVSSAEPLHEKISQMAEENPDAEIFQVKEEPAPKVVEKKK